MFTYDWFSNNIENWKQWLSEFKDKENMAFLEIGCYEGKATRWMLDNILTHRDSFIHCIDTFQGSIEHSELDNSRIESNFFENTVKVYPDKVFVHKGNSYKILKKMDVFFDFIYVDGSHQAPDVIEDLVLSFRLLNKSGIMVMDDYCWDKYEDKTLNPRLAIDAFLSIFEGKYQLIGKGYQVAIRKL